MQKNFEEKFNKYLESTEINLEKNEEEKFEMYKNNLCEWNEKINLTTILDEEEIIVKHFIDSLTCSKYIKENDKIIDIGTGAGFPGIPLKIFFDEKLKVTLMDSLNKRINFLQDTVDKLNLNEVELIHGRAEELGRNKKYREKFDICTSRAVANLKVLSEYCIPFVKLNGYFLSMKGSEIENEIDEAKDIIKKLGGEIEKVDLINLPMDIKHSIIVIKKVKNTPENFPRKQSQIKK